MKFTRLGSYYFVPIDHLNAHYLRAQWGRPAGTRDREDRLIGLVRAC